MSEFHMDGEDEMDPELLKYLEGEREKYVRGKRAIREKYPSEQQFFPPAIVTKVEEETKTKSEYRRIASKLAEENRKHLSNEIALLIGVIIMISVLVGYLGRGVLDPNAPEVNYEKLYALIAGVLTMLGLGRYSYIIAGKKIKDDGKPKT